MTDILDKVRERHGDDLKWLAEHRERLDEDWKHSDYYELASIRDLVAEVERLRSTLQAIGLCQPLDPRIARFIEHGIENPGAASAERTS